MFKLNVLTPERKAVFDQEITEVTVPAYLGEITILPGHSPLITTLGTGILKYKVKGQDKIFKAVLSWGYCEITTEAVNVLAEFIQTPEEIVAEDMHNMILASEKKLTQTVLNDQEFKFEMNELSKARSAIELIKH